jgi:hypothetical protein
MAAVLVGLIVALAPAALFAYDQGTDKIGGTQVVAQATATAAPKTGTATPAAPKTGNAGIATQAGTAGVAALLVVLTAGVVVGGRVLAARRS